MGDGAQGDAEGGFWRIMRVWGALLACLLLAACGVEKTPAQVKLEEWVGTDLSSLQVMTLDGEPQPLKDVFLFETANKPVVVNVWATWCPPCLAEMPTLDALGKSGRAIVVAIATDKDAQTVKDFLKQQSWGSGMQVWHDPLGTVTRQIGALGLPSSYVLDSSLVVRMVAAGERDWAAPRVWAEMEDAVQ